MPFRRIVPTLTSLLVITLGCGDDSTTAPEESEPAFARALNGPHANVYATDLTVLSDGALVVAGTFAGAMHVTGELDSLQSTALTQDVFLVAFHTDGSLAWKRDVSGTGQEISYGMARDADDNIYIGGSYRNNSVFGGTNLTNNGLEDALVARFDSGGNMLWALSGGAPGYDIVWDIAATGDGEVFACGSASSEIVLAGEDMGELNSDSGFLVNIHSSGAGSWAATAHGPANEQCNAVVTTGDGHVLVAGQYSGNLVDIGGVVMNGEGDDIFIARYTLTGDPAGVIRIGGPGYSTVSEVTHLNNGAVVVGSLNLTEDFDVTASGGEATGSGGDAFVARYDADGTFRWVRTFGGSGSDIAYDVCRIGASDLLVTGSFSGTVQFGSSFLEAINLTDVFLMRLDSAGNVKKAFQAGGQGNDVGVSVRARGASITLAGQTEADELLLPNGSKLQADGDSFIYHQP